MRATNHDYKTSHFDDALSEVVAEIMEADSDIRAEVHELFKLSPEGLRSRNQRRDAHYPSEN